MLVDEKNKEIGEVTRDRVRNEVLWHRASYVFILVESEKGQNKFLVQERVMNKDYAPGCFDITTGGVFSPREEKLENAVREVEEEVGLKIDPNLMQDAGWLSYTDLYSKVW